jgi:hypothetical protein
MGSAGPRPGEGAQQRLCDFLCQRLGALPSPPASASTQPIVPVLNTPASLTHLRGKPLLRLAPTACPGGIALHLPAPSAATARIPPRHGAVSGAGAKAMALRIGDIADTSQLLDCPRRRGKAGPAKATSALPAATHRRPLPPDVREDGAVLNLLAPAHHTNASGLHRSPNHR